MSYSLRFVLLPLVWLMACTPAEDGSKGEYNGPGPEERAKPEDAPAPLTADSAAPSVIEIAVGGATGGGGTVEIAPITRAAALPSWKERGSVEGELSFISFTAGMLARGPGGYFELDEAGEALAQRRELEIPAGEMIGYWPSSVWHVEVEAMVAEAMEPEEPRFYYQMSTFVDRKGQWETLRRRGAKRWHDGPMQFRKGWHGGLLLRKDNSIARVGSKRPKPRAGARKGKTIVDMFETRSGRLYTVSLRAGALYVQANCGDISCVEANALRLPRGTGWRFSMQAPRSSRHGSMLASVRDGGADEELHYLLSYDKHAWLLEPLPEAPLGLWPDIEGGLWVVVSDELWHRDRSGAWRVLELPTAGAGISAAMRLDQQELWVALPHAGMTELFSTSGTPG